MLIVYFVLFSFVQWDTNGKERFRYTRYPSFSYRGAQGVIIVYDITSMESFDEVKQQYIEDIERYACEDISRLLVGNKSDLTYKRAVETVSAKEFADSLGIPFFETSAKNAMNVEEVFITLISKIMDRMASTAQQHDDSGSNVSLEPQTGKHTKKSCSC